MEPIPTNETPDGSATPTGIENLPVVVKDEIKVEEARFAAFVKKHLPVVIAFIAGVALGIFITLTF